MKRKFTIYASTSNSNWPSADEWDMIDSDEAFEDMWDSYLSGPEDEVNNELQIFPEPSIQGGSGAMFIFDQSGEDRTENGYRWAQGFGDWCDWEESAARASRNAEEYKQKYREHIKKICGI